MVYYLSILQSLFTQIWYWPIIILSSLYLYQKQKKVKHYKSDQANPFWILCCGAITFVVFAVAYWIFGDNAAHSFSDDVTHTLQTYLSSSYRGDSINWTNSLSGGMDRWLLPNCHPWSFGRLYALFLHKPQHLYLFVIAINVLLVFIFTWKIQNEMWKMRPWAAYIGSVIAVIVQGYWTGIYPDAHVSNGHGFAFIIVAVYVLTQFAESRLLWLVAMLVGVAMALGSWTPFHNLPPLLITISIWGMIFWGDRAWIKVLKANAFIVLAFTIVLFPYLLAIKLLFSGSGRFEVFRPSVELAQLYLLPEVIILVVIGGLAAALGAFRQKLAIQVLLMFLGFAVLPFIAHLIEASHLMPAFRWQLLYAGNESWIWLAVIFFIERIQGALQELFMLGGIACRLIVISAAWIFISFAWMNSLWMDLISSYPSGNWKSLTDTSMSALIKGVDQKPMRVVGIDDTNDMHFWGQIQGLESMLGYTPFIDRKKTYFWWYSAMSPALRGAYTAAFLSIPIPVAGHDKNLDFPVPLSTLINLDALRIANVHWIVSHHPLYPEPGLEKFMDQQGQAAACHPITKPLTQIDLGSLSQYWQDVICIAQDYKYPRPLYVYHLSGDMPRAYVASHVFAMAPNQPPVLVPEQLAAAAQKAAFVESSHLPANELSGQGNVDIEIYQSDYMRLKIQAEQPAMVIISSTLNSYWQILVDNQKTSFFDVNGFQTGFMVPANAHEAELIYCPPWRPAQHRNC